MLDKIKLLEYLPKLGTTLITNKNNHFARRYGRKWIYLEEEYS